MAQLPAFDGCLALARPRRRFSQHIPRLPLVAAAHRNLCASPESTLVPVWVNQEVAPKTSSSMTSRQNIVEAGSVCKIPAGFATPGTRIQVRYMASVSHRMARSMSKTSAGPNVRMSSSREDAAEKTFRPHFTFHGFQYVEISGLTQGRFRCENVTGCVVRSAIAQWQATSNAPTRTVNRLWLNGLWSQRDNFLSDPHGLSTRPR